MKTASPALDLLQFDKAPANRSGTGKESGGFAATFERELREQSRPAAVEEPRKVKAERDASSRPEETEAAAPADAGGEPDGDVEASATAEEMADEAASTGEEGGNELPLLADAGGLFVDWAALIGSAESPPPAGPVPSLGERSANPPAANQQVLGLTRAESARAAEPGVDAGKPDQGDDGNGDASREAMSDRLFRALAERAGTGGKQADAGAPQAGRGISNSETLRFSELLRAPAAAVTAPGAAVAASQPASIVAQTPVVTVPTPMPNQNGWNQAFSERVVWMARGNIQEAQIQLNPRHLGPVEVRLSVGQDQQVNVQFTAQHATTREAIEQALPRLRDMLGDSGLQLGQADVGDYAARGQNGDQQQGNGRGSRNRGAGTGDGDSVDPELHETPIAAADDGAIDYFA